MNNDIIYSKCSPLTDTRICSRLW